MSSAAARMRLMRERVANDRAKLAIDTKIGRLALALAEDGFLQEWDDRDRAAIEAALQAMVETYVIAMIGPDVTP
jgi:hypothetical protein